MDRAIELIEARDKIEWNDGCGQKSPIKFRYDGKWEDIGDLIVFIPSKTYDELIYLINHKSFIEGGLTDGS